jgi:hypothetical protein
MQMRAVADFSGTAAVKASLERIQDDWELRAQALPPRAQWDEAVRRMSALFGKVQSQGLNAGSPTRLLDELGPLVEQSCKPLTALVSVLEQRLRALGVRLEEAPRLTTARSAVALVEQADEAGLVLLTAADDTKLGADLLAWLWRGRVFHLQSWDLVPDLFKAREIDPRLAPMGWIADLLVEQAPPGGYAPAPGGFLSADLAWQQVLAVCLGLCGGRPDAITLVEWSLREDASVRFGCIAPAARADLAGWLLRTAGPAARPILACVAAVQGAEVLPSGLVCELIFRDGSDRDPVRSAVAARLERYTDGQRVDPVAGRRWGEAAAAVLARLGGGVDSTSDPRAGGVGVVTRWEPDADDGTFAARGFAAEAAPTGALPVGGRRRISLGAVSGGALAEGVAH